MLVKATRHLFAAALFGATAPAVANASMQMAQTAAPVTSIDLRPKYLINGKAVTEPANPHVLMMTVTTKGFFRPTIVKKKVP
jgi:hypothetical protein